MDTRKAEHYPWEYFAALAPYIYGIDRVDITGGEPTSHPQFGEFVPKFRELFGCKRLTLETNGFKARENVEVGAWPVAGLDKHRRAGSKPDCEERVKDYSQENEQHHILNACPQEYGKFLDLGAWNPFDNSNTRALFERGWSGVMLEPSPGPLANILAEYGSCERVTVYGKAIALTPGTVSMWISDDGLSTSEKAIFDKWKHLANYRPQKIEVETVTLEELYEKHGPFDFVNIDVEGLSVDIFNRLLDLGHRPRCICLEYDERLEEARNKARMVGYAEWQYNGTNIVLVYG